MYNKIYYAIFASGKGSKDLVKVVESIDYASYLSAQFHINHPKQNFKVWASDKYGMFTTWKEPIIINGSINKKGAQ